MNTLGVNPSPSTLGATPQSRTLGVTHSACGRCRTLVPAKIILRGDQVYFRKFCPACGEHEALVCRDADYYLRCQRYVKPAWTPVEFAGRTDLPCPAGCGFCRRHEQHLCMPIVEITARCDLACPICLVDAGADWDMTVGEFSGLLDGLLRAERQIDALTLSGGEPLLHPRLLDIVDAVAARPEVIRTSISTNGLALLSRGGLLEELARRNVVISLQLDGFDDAVCLALRGRAMTADKREILDRLARAGVTTSLTLTAAGGVNDHQFAPVLEYFFAQPHVVSLMVQPLAMAGRAAKWAVQDRLTVPETIQLLGRAGTLVREEDFAPLPCSHPQCFALAYYLMLDGGGRVPLNQLIQAGPMMDALANRTIFGLDPAEHDRLKDMIYDLWSGPAGACPDSQAVLRTLRSVLDEVTGGGFEPRAAFRLAERRVKSIFIHAFQDADTFDLARVRRCCNAYAQADGRLIPACVHNVLGRKTGTGAIFRP